MNSANVISSPVRTTVTQGQRRFSGIYIPGQSPEAASGADTDVHGFSTPPPKRNSRTSETSTSRVRHRRSATSLGFVSRATARPPIRRNTVVNGPTKRVDETKDFNRLLKLASKKKKPNSSTVRHRRRASVAGRIEMTSDRYPTPAIPSPSVQVLRRRDSLLPPNLISELQVNARGWSATEITAI
jgi:hypothetical protein